MSEPYDPFAVLTTPPPAVTSDAVAGCLERHYALRGLLSPLDSERDQNFRLDTDDGSTLVIKIANSAELAEVTAFQSAALVHIASVDPDFPCPRVIRAANGDCAVGIEDVSGRGHRLRVVSWLDGAMMGNSQPGSLAASIGDSLSRLNIVLCDFDHPGAKVPLLWDVSNANDVAPLVKTIGDSSLRKVCERQFARFADDISPALLELRQQVIHNDFNPGNVLVDPAGHDRVVGIIDFGDMVRAPLVVDVATAAAYLAIGSRNPAAEVEKFLTAYERSNELQDEERALVDDLIIMRLVVSTTIAHWRARQFPENARYIMVTQQETVELLLSMSKGPS